MAYSSTKMNRDASPVPDIYKNLFSTYSTSNRSSRKRCSRPSLEEDLQKDLEENKENIGVACARRASRKLSRPGEDYVEQTTKVLSSRSLNVAAEVFQYPSPRPQGAALPRISVHQEDDEVFDSSEWAANNVGFGNKAVLTPSTAHSPVVTCGSASLLPSPGIERGLCCSTPNRIKLESEGLSSTEKMVLGRGAFGTVVLGRWRGRKVAIKVMEKEEGGRTARRRNSLEGELQAKNLEHKNIVRVFDVYAKDNQYAIIIMEYVGSRNLHRLLVETPDKQLEPGLLLTAASHVSAALAHCHARGVLHLDVKPANVLVSSQAVFKLGDFGCSVSASGPKLGVDHSLVGTPGYQAPEFLRGCAASAACDVYSLGVLLWQLETREVPFSGQHPQAVMYQVVARGARPDSSSPSLQCVNIPAFTSLYRACWHAAHTARPSSKDVVETLNMIIKRNSIKLDRVSSFHSINKSLRL